MVNAFNSNDYTKMILKNKNYVLNFKVNQLNFLMNGSISLKV